ncbi:PadR family transcriptional regulator [Allonocardiopsis opalescens]|uniref:PadR family transcriptional regulator n=1 Tax=Allonocardiopsis opalescens TaxID=1144618 RepID=A0A2T0QA40_9ACTN|nr:PadR family transcriptional regulator [Allonocardiopsis opalescens]PRY00680.1 PadR family transcriptional regulator [Allonocardiopsis opalescens]
MSGRASTRDLVELTVLALLTRGPQHPYALHRQIREYRKDYVTGLPRSLYHAVERLAEAEFIAAVETSRAGRRPERTVYELTDEGRAELRDRLRVRLETPVADPAPFTAALSLLGVLSPAEAGRALATRAAGLDGRIAAVEATLAGLSAVLPRLLLIEHEFERARLTAERDWVRGLLGELERGELDLDPARAEPPGGPPPEGGR